MKNKLNKNRTWVELDMGAIKNNYTAFRSHIPKKCMLMSVVKSNAYGHDLIKFGSEITSLNIDWLGVDSIGEGVLLRNAKIKKPILVFGHLLKEDISDVTKNNISITVSNFEVLKNILKNKNKKKINIHIKVDSGMHRQGFLEKDINKLIKIIKKNQDKINIEGLYTHFPTVKNPLFPHYEKKQLKIFERWVTKFKNNKLNPIVHASATLGTLLLPEATFDMVRIGIGMYGLYPSHKIKKGFEKTLKLKPVLSWKTIISEIKELPKNSYIGYDLLGKITKKSKIAVLPIGYWHGYAIGLSNVAFVLVGDKKAKILGRVSMDMVVVDITGIKNVKVNDDVIIIGCKNGKEITADELADLSNTINYEIVTRINPEIERIIK